MSKKKTGLFIVLAAAVGAAAGCASYYLRYKSFNKELDRDFHDYEDGYEGKEDSDGELTPPDPSKRTYITIDPIKPETEPPCPGQEQDGKDEKENVPTAPEADGRMESSAEPSAEPESATVEEDHSSGEPS